MTAAASPVSSSVASSSSDPLRINWKGVSLVVLTPALGGFLYGYDIGAISFVLKRLLNTSTATSTHDDDDFYRRREDVEYATDDTYLGAMYELHKDNDSHDSYWWDELSQSHHRIHQGLLVGAVSAGALLGSHLVLVCLSSSKLSRRMELRIAATLYIVGNLLSISSGRLFQHTSFTVGWFILVCGRLLFGIGVGLVMHGAPTYMAEMAPTRIRGAIVSAKESIIVLGILVGFGVGDFLDNVKTSWAQDWTWLFLVSCALSTPMLLLTFMIPRSKRWLLLNGSRREAKESMEFIYHGNVDDEFDKLASDIDRNRAIIRKDSGTLDVDIGCISFIRTRLCAPHVRPALQTALKLVFFQQLSGQPSILTYASVLFQAAGWNGHAVLATAIVMLCGSTFTVLMVDTVGRKRLMSVCCATMLLSAFTLALVFWDWQGGDRLGPAAKWVALFAMLLYIGGYQLGFGPITWLVVSEVFPQDVRGPAMALCVEFNYLLNCLVQCVFPVVQNLFGWGPTFLIFASAVLVAFGFVQTSVSETRGLSLEEIESHLMQDEAMEIETFISEESSLLENMAAGVGRGTTDKS